MPSVPGAGGPQTSRPTFFYAAHGMSVCLRAFHCGSIQACGGTGRSRSPLVLPPLFDRLGGRRDELVAANLDHAVAAEADEVGRILSANLPMMWPTAPGTVGVRRRGRITLLGDCFDWYGVLASLRTRRGVPRFRGTGGNARAASLRPIRVSAANDLGGGRDDLVAANLDAMRIAVEADDPRWVRASEPADDMAASPRCVVAVGRYQSNEVVREELVSNWGCHT